MSSLLEQAIIDAKALRSAALKNAEQMVIEKYTDQIKEAVTVLLEQEEDLEEDPLSMEDPLAAADPMADADPMAAEDPEGLEGEESSEDEEENEKLIDQVPASDIGKVEIDLDAIEKKIAEIEAEEGIHATDALEGDKLDRDEVAAGMSDSIQASSDADSLATETFLTQELEEEIENMFIDEIMESLEVDIKPQKSGWMGTSNEELDLATEMELARAQDDEVKEQLEALKTALDKLEESNMSLNGKNKDFNIKNKELTAELDMYKNAVTQLKEKFDVVNTSNAKLLYINRTLDCSSLNERQKKKIVESIAKAADAKEAKVIYETLQSTVETKHEKKSPESLSEAVNRGPSLLVHARKETRTTSADMFADRMQRLAGIKKDN
jgi:hypothetical protein